MPHQIGPRYADRFVRIQQDGLQLLPLGKLVCPSYYTDSYAAKLYERIARELSKRESRSREKFLTNANLILLYVDRTDGSESTLFERFGVEALVMSLKVPSLSSMPMVRGDQQELAVKKLIGETKRALRQAEELLSVIAEEVTNRDNRTCLLLPPETFGEDFHGIRERIRDAAHNREDGNRFRESLNMLSGALRTSEGKYFVGDGGLVFKCPGKARARHGLAPLLDEGDHRSSCVIRGRLRFGVSFDPRFHYDCEIERKKELPGCHHTPQSVPKGHVNIAPNDNIRYRK